MEKLFLVQLDIKYCEYLRKFDFRVPYIKNQKSGRPFVGVLFKVNDFMYFAPLSSPKPKHLKMNDKIDFLKIKKGNLGAINFNNMVPVLKDNIIEIKLDGTNKYDRLLMNQLSWINEYREKIYKKSSDLYNKYICNNLDKKIIDRCCDFKLLEEKCLEYNREEIKI